MTFLWISAIAFWLVLILGAAWIIDWLRHT
jgi:hypothetical protein